MTTVNLHPDITRQLTARVPVTKDVFLTLPDAARMRAFTIARVTEANVLQQTLDAVRDTVEKGGTLWQFKENFPDLAAQYRDAGREWHLDMIFQENAKQAYATGAYEARQRTKQFLPYVEYIAGAYRGDIEPRPSHTALHGKIFHIDDPFLLAHTPPWDFNCDCDLVSRTAAQVDTARAADQGRELEEQQVVPGNAKLENLASRNKMPLGERIGAGGSIYPVDVTPPALKGGEYSFRPDTLNQVVDLSGYDPDIRAALEKDLQSVGYVIQGDTAVPGPVPSAHRAVKGRVAAVSASKVGTAAHAGDVGGGRGGGWRVGRGTGRVGKPAPQIARVATSAGRTMPRLEAA